MARCPADSPVFTVSRGESPRAGHFYPRRRNKKARQPFTHRAAGHGILFRGGCQISQRFTTGTRKAAT